MHFPLFSHLSLFGVIHSHLPLLLLFIYYKCYQDTILEFPSQWFADRLQLGLYSLVWPSLLGGCELTRPTAKWLWELEPWSKIRLNPVKGYTGYEVNPDITGFLVKPMPGEVGGDSNYNEPTKFF